MRVMMPLIDALWFVAVAAALLAATSLAQAAAGALRHQAIDRAAGALADLFIFIDAGRLWRTSAVAAALMLALVAVLSGALLVALCVAGVVFAAPRLLHRWWRQRYLRQIARQLPDAIAMLAGAVRAGAALSQGLDQLVPRAGLPLAHELALVMRRHRVGVRLDEALQEFAHRVPLPEVQLLATAMGLAMQLGGSLAGTLDRLTDSLRRKHVIEAKLRALTSQGRLQAIIVTALPIALMLALTALDPRSMRPLFVTPAGWAVLGGIALLEGTGWLLIRRVVAIDV